jgi:hypothetical protein
MVVSTKKLSELQEKLNYGNMKVVSDAIVLLRNEEYFRGAICLLASLFDTTNDIIIKDLIRSFLNDIKEPEAREEVVTEAKKGFKHETTSMLVSSCWQSGMDYSEFAADFANIFITGDYITALECFTVIEESAGSIQISKKNEIILFLEKNKPKSSVEKASLLQAMITILS